MNDTNRQQARASSRRSAVSDREPADLAPSAERAWTEEFVLEQRLLGVPGPHIGDALVTVESHLLESGESAHDAFGDARSYARELAESVEKDEGPVSAATATSSTLGLVGMLATAHAFGAWLDGEAAAVTAGALVAAGLLLAALAVLLVATNATFRLLVSRWWVGALLLTLPVVASVLALVLLPTVAFEVDARILGAVGVVLVASSGVLSWFDRTAEDLVLAPGEEPGRQTTGQLRLALVLPAATGILLVFTLVLHLLV